jgi:sec-independent protein translocase protein TatC
MTDTDHIEDKSTDAESGDTPLPLVAHLTELRDRLMRAVLAVLAVLIALLAFSNDIYAFVSEPLRKLLPPGSSMIATDVGGTFFAPFKATVVTALMICIPYILYQIWSFIAPGLYKKEKRLAVPLLLSSVLLFYAGMAFAYYAVFPVVFGFFSHIAPEGVSYTPDITKFLDMALKMLLAFGCTFEIPVATYLLVWSGITTVASLTAKRPYVIVGCFIAGALLSPPDVLSQTMMAVPMWLLFEAGVLASRLIKKSDADEESTEITPT